MKHGLIVDLFAGGGGASLGIELALGRDVDIAINHDATALAVHRANHPRTLHLEADVWEVKPIEATRGRPVELLWASPDCFPAGTLILTPTGLTPIEQVQVGDLVLTHQARWRRVTSLMSKIAATVEVRGHGHYGLVTTTNHPFYSKRITRRFPGRKREDGKRVGLRRELAENPYWPAAESMAGKLWAAPRTYPDTMIPTCSGAEFSDAFFYFVGRWIGDGSLNKGDVEICCGHHEASAFAELATSLEMRRASGERVAHRVVTRPSTVAFVWGNAALASWLREQFGGSCESKHLPTWCLAMQASWRRGLLRGYIESDGHIGARVETSTVSRALAIGMRLLAVSIGHAAALYMQPGRAGEIEGRSFEGSDLFRVAWRDPLLRETVFWDTRHMFSPVREVTPTGRTELVHSLEVEEDESFVADGIVVHNCRHFSSAKGDVPKSKGIRSLAWTVTRWAKAVRPRVICVENVIEFQSWCKLGKDGRPVRSEKGKTFRAWIRRLERLGYDVDWRVLDSSHYGAPTKRRRLYVVARCDGEAIVWPDATHGRGLKPMRTAAECIDWTIGCPSIFERKRPLAPKTLWRIAEGIRRYVLDSPRPFLVEMNHSNAPREVRSPLGVVTSQHNRHNLVTPIIARTAHGDVGANGSTRRGRGAHESDQPLPTVTGSNDFALAAPVIAKMRFDSAGSRVDEPLPTITAGQGREQRPAGAGHALGVIAPHIVQVNHGKNEVRGSSAQEPLPTVTATQRSHAVVAPLLSKYHGGDPRNHSLEDPTRTLDCSNRIGLIAPTLVQTGYGEREGQRPRALDLHAPLGTCVDGQKHALVTGFLAKFFGGEVGHAFDEQVPTVTARDHNALAAASLVKLRGDCIGSDIHDPVPTISAQGTHVAEVRAFLERHCANGRSDDLFQRDAADRRLLGLVTIDGVDHQIVDIGLRMLEPHELLRAQFGEHAESYSLADARTKSAQVRLVGNSVVPHVAEALVRANVEQRAVAEVAG